MDKSLASRCKELLQFLSSTSGDLANVTGPPSMLAPMSVVEVGRCWAQRPAVFAAPALEPAADRRCLLVLRMVLIALRSQMYVGGSPSTSIKKPLNAFLGELFLAEWTDEKTHGVESRSPSARSSLSSQHQEPGLSRSTTISSSATNSTNTTTSSTSSSCACGTDRITTRLVAEQVSHHPPITAMHISDDVHGVRADGYARVEMTFSGSVQVRQVGHAVVRVDAYDEDYLIPLPVIKVRGFLSGRLYPEITETYHVVGSSGYTAEIKFSGQGLAWGGTRNAFTAKVFGPSEPGSTKRDVLYTIEGVWSKGWTVRDARSGAVLETYDVDAPENKPAPIDLPDTATQDPWESRRAWAGVLDGLGKGDLSQTVAEKSKIEQAQRRMRAREAAAGEVWTPLFFKNAEHDGDAVFHRLAAAAGAAGTHLQLHDDRTKGVWRVDDNKIKNLQRPFRAGLTPLGEQA
ncbi:uncharacterized protein SPSK_07505 [Sporothrix schenckii 1099-18]|uniref:Oxysterol-binding protein n=1 Tax=Sporothrix schenckii 1099-18 TaxID=1397361 RepID=A0A0F2MJC4_SPOSC|nr:uncharacterized protein SPSK_07505 [Sporothrix schenckii 1099-18]KJR88281.1 hypothetical protein SPSK_07505 [Sporothrix schenckii 1099-18]